jgi:hypothetical protein
VFSKSSVRAWLVVIISLMMFKSSFEPLLHQLDILLGSRYATFRLLLEDLEDIHSKLKPDSIYL